jgi:CBS domain-containing protein
MTNPGGAFPQCVPGQCSSADRPGSAVDRQSPLEETYPMQAQDIMSTAVISVAPDTPVKEIAALLFEKRISGVPVLDEGRLVGLVSEGDLLRRHELGTDRPGRSGSWWLRLFSADQTALDYVKTHAQGARDIMTRDVVTVSAETTLPEIATLLESHGIKRVPVMRGAELVGIVSRANLVQALAGMRAAPVRVTPPADQAIRGRLQAELERHSWWRKGASNVIVTDGVVHYFGAVETDNEQDAARVAAENIPGVRGIEDHRVRFRQLAGW